MIFEFYKNGQGKYSRGLAIISLGSLALFGCLSLHNALLFGFWKDPLYTVPGADLDITPALLVMIGVALLAAGVLYYFNNRKTVVDFLIETEGELRKVTWPSRDSVIGSSLVVVVTVIIMGVLIYLSDIVISTLLHDVVYKIGS